MSSLEMHDTKKEASIEAVEAIHTIPNKLECDEADMLRFGKRQQMKRSFGLISATGFTATLMITWEGLLVTFVTDLMNGGSAGLVYGYIFTWIGNILQVLVMAEMGSMIPLSGGQYNWVAVLAPSQYSRFLSYLTGWTALIGWQAGVASSIFLTASVIQGVVVLNHPEYVPEPWKVTLIVYAVLLFVVFVNTRLAHYMPKVEAFFFFIHVLGFFAILVPLVVLAPAKSSATEVFTVFTNGGEFPTTGLSFFVGLSGAMFAFIGIDSAAHVAEEIENAAVVIPRSMVAATLINGSLGLGMTIGILFVIGNLDDALSSPTGFPFIEIFRQATGSDAGTTAMTCLIIAILIIATVGIFISASRMTWAFARERGIPGAGHLGRVHEGTRLPLYSIALTALIAALLALINIGSTTAFNALISLVVASFYSNFLLAAGVMLHKRLTCTEEIQYGPFKLGRAGVPVIILAMVYSVIGTFFSFWPPAKQVTAASMNWSSVVFVGSLALSLVFWFTHGRILYTGPIMEISSLPGKEKA